MPHLYVRKYSKNFSRGSHTNDLIFLLIFITKAHALEECVGWRTVKKKYEPNYLFDFPINQPIGNLTRALHSCEIIILFCVMTGYFSPTEQNPYKKISNNFLLKKNCHQFHVLYTVVKYYAEIIKISGKFM